MLMLRLVLAEGEIDCLRNPLLIDEMDIQMVLELLKRLRQGETVPRPDHGLHTIDHHDQFFVIGINRCIPDAEIICPCFHHAIP
jgi:hypothetical protein